MPMTPEERREEASRWMREFFWPDIREGLKSEDPVIRARSERVLANAPSEAFVRSERRGRRPPTPEHNAKNASGQHRRFEDPKERANLSRKLKGRRFSAETKAKMSAAWTPERRAAQAERRRLQNQQVDIAEWMKRAHAEGRFEKASRHHSKRMKQRWAEGRYDHLRKQP